MIIESTTPTEAVPEMLIVPLVIVAWSAYFLMRRYNRDH